MKIKWEYDKYGGGRTAKLGANLTLCCPYPMTHAGMFDGYVFGKLIGTYDFQDRAMKECEEYAIKVIKALNEKFVICTKSEGEKDE